MHGDGYRKTVHTHTEPYKGRVERKKIPSSKLMQIEISQKKYYRDKEDKIGI